MAGSRSRRPGRSSRIGWFDFRPERGTVYLMQPASDPSLFKIGYTSRPTMDRRRELQKRGDVRLHIVCTLTLPHAYALEQRLLARMRKNRLWGLFRRKPSSRGTEWFHLHPWENIHIIEAIMEQEAFRVQRCARLKLSWPLLERIRIYQAPRPIVAFLRLGRPRAVAPARGTRAKVC